ncbi:hypothetical protein GCK32_001809 [Trichostrongylus colubriformis]|uniref:Abnormal cell migration protein 18-like fibronectin type I domain-containing protein n=1 Tax=Trichostrongylus colubriformis TaxID=6319 RepID=A0AAN8IHC8_TRICO
MILKLLILSVCLPAVWPAKPRMYCTYKGEKHKKDEIWVMSKHWKFQCKIEGSLRRSMIIACIVPNTNIEIPVGEEKRVERLLWKCKKMGSQGLVVYMTSEFHPEADCAEQHKKG